jgi:hypothetical protein
MYNYIEATGEKFRIVCWFGLGGAILTWLFLPDTTGLDLKEQERRWNYIRAGPEQDYHGIAIHPQHLSLWERFRGIHKNYDPELDYNSKVEEMRQEWEEWQARKAAEHEKDEAFDDEEWSEEVSTYFRRTGTPGATPMMAGMEKKSESDEDEKRAFGDPAIGNGV